MEDFFKPGNDHFFDPGKTGDRVSDASSFNPLTAVSAALGVVGALGSPVVTNPANPVNDWASDLARAWNGGAK